MQPDIITPITPANPTGPQAWTWIDGIHITRQGSKAVTGVDQLEDTWQIEVRLRASLALGGAVVPDERGREVSVSAPLPNRTYDVADLLHDPAVQQLAVLIRDVTMRIASGELRPLI